MDPQAPTRSELAERASKLVPLLRSKAAWHEENRRLHDEVIEALADAGMFKLRVPRQYGGYEADTRTLVDVGTELGRGDGSTAWTTAVYWIPGWMVGLFPDHVQEEVYSTPDVRICGTLSPSAVATRKNGGVVVNGKWGFISGAWHSHWQEIIAIADPEGDAPEPIMALVPMSELEIVDDWHTAGLQGTGSVSTIANELFVPQERVLSLPAVLSEQYASAANAELPMFQAPLVGVAGASAVGTVIGLARAAMEVFLERMPHRKITYTGYAKQSDAPVTHLQVAEATLKSDQAEFHARRLAELVDHNGITGQPWTMQERARGRADVGAVCQLAKEAIDILNMASGGSSIYSGVPIQRINRDVQTINLHALMAPQASYELYGRVLCGLEPDTSYI